MATLTITTTAAEDARISAAYGADIGVGVNATLAQVKAVVRQSIVDKVLAYEQAAQARAAASGVVAIAPT